LVDESASVFGLSRNEKVRIALIYVALAIATVCGFFLSFVVGKVTVVLAGLGVIAYVLGLRHGVDADHIAAIDNTTRKLLQEGEHPFTVGMWFSLGHSTIVVALIVGLVAATRSVAASIPALQSVGAILGTAISGTFLLIIGLVNAIIVLGVYRAFQLLKKDRLNAAELDDLLEKRGFMNRYFRPLFKIVKKPWQIYPIGVLFGLGFDTASEVALIGISVGLGVSTSVPIYYILVLPLMFTCGMVTVDTTDGVTMRVAYGWAFMNPVRRIYYNLTVTVISVLVAWAIGAVELLQVLSSELDLSGGLWNAFNSLDFETIGFLIVGVFVSSWLISLGYWKYKGYDTLYVRSSQT